MKASCEQCKIEIGQSLIGRKRKFCDKCAKDRQNTYYRKWYVARGKTRKRSNTRTCYTEEMRERLRAAARLWNRRNPEKRAAHKAVEQARREGILVRPEACSQCGRTDKLIDAHHDDYSKPLEIRWLCQPCHFRHHRQTRKAQPSVRP